MTATERSIGPTPWGRAFAWITFLTLCLGPLAIAERAFGLDGSLAVQEVLLPIGLVGGTISWRRYGPSRRGKVTVLHVAPNRLELREHDRQVAGIERSQVGAIILDGGDSAFWGALTLVIHDKESRVLDRWVMRWPGRRPASVVRILSRAGWPAAVGAELYDGCFQAQEEGKPPILHRPEASRQ